MPMQEVEGQVALGDKLWFIPSPAQSTECLVIAHGGKLHGDGTFKAEMTIKFAAKEGKSLMTSSTHALYGESFKGEVIGSGGTCIDYSLAKFVGHPEKMDYVGLRKMMHNRINANGGCPNIVTIRNRSFITGNSKVVHLSEVQSLVKGHDSRINTLLVNACRGESDSWLGMLKASVFGV